MCETGAQGTILQLVTMFEDNPIYCDFPVVELAKPLRTPCQKMCVSYRGSDNATEHMVEAPKPGKGNYFRRDVHYRRNTLLSLFRTLIWLGGIQRLLLEHWGGGIKHPFLWVDYKRHVPEGMEGPLIERVLQIVYEPSRTAHVALVGYADKLRYIIATEI
ncbi:50S ribosomal protein L2 [Orchesella cincta]|uniref:50S ribosomal protein L2 n=1 Tax=Orchesella cincta TaxID=48709 RepID=A0A1D2MG84_ORCCI|nr:50S ribosomal protein L2 [Orchesella cincta]